MSSSPHSQSTDDPWLADRNYWATYKDKVIRWYGELPPPSELGMDRVFDLTRRVLAAGEREQVMHVVESPDPWSFKLKKGWTWFDYVRGLFEREGRITLFPDGGPTHQEGGRLRLPARLAYYREDQLVEEDVEDPGLLLQSLHQTGEYRGRYSTTPLWLRGYSRTGEDWVREHPPDKLWISLGLFTDIWFPRVIGQNAGDSFGNMPDLVPVHPARGRDRLMDNSALATRHTPRLNRFIQVLREAILELGGTWKFDPMETHEAYLPMIHDGGINLDYPAADA